MCLLNPSSSRNAEDRGRMNRVISRVNLYILVNLVAHKRTLKVIGNIYRGTHCLHLEFSLKNKTWTNSSLNTGNSTSTRDAMTVHQIRSRKSRSSKIGPSF